MFFSDLPAQMKREQIDRAYINATECEGILPS